MRYVLFMLLLPIFLLGGCGQETSTSSSHPAKAATIEGSVFDDDGPVRQASIEVLDKNENHLVSTRLDPQGHFKIKIPSSANYPVILQAKLKDGKVLEAVLINDQVVELDISPFTDLVVKSARLNGGLTPKNITIAAGAAINMRRSQGGKRSSSGFKGDLTKQYGGWH